ncbi:hypothetical protein FIBSPDRAFT_135867 [Athelia psychrophila]|uniref:MYND-type domain-containing protein n=1 Tax=Athelia psychrophila TaxID=1759441 RepID=A0A166C7F3_9AGAM|nr:hypothetical protein FIBSPDRAFT_135867 [Fibularhizoctonia sp. CBS 109695]
MAKALADSARVTNPLPASIDLSLGEQKEVRDQINAMRILPPPALKSFWRAFAANHLSALGSSMRSLSYDHQPIALSTYIQILSLLPDPKDDPYFRRFLQHPTQSKDIPNIIASAFVKGIPWHRPSGPGYISTLMIHCLFWVDPKSGSDGRGSIDLDIRQPLQVKLKALLDIAAPEGGNRADWESQRVDVERLSGIIGCLASEEVGPHYIQSTQQYLQRDLDGCAKEDCDEEGELRCSVCKIARYCGKKHQAWHWKNGHKMSCFPSVD